MTSSGVLAFPDSVQDGDTTFTIYDCPGDVELRKKLEDDFDKKYSKCNSNSCIYNYPPGAYEREVVIPFALNSSKEHPIIYQGVLVKKK